MFQIQSKDLPNPQIKKNEKILCYIKKTIEAKDECLCCEKVFPNIINERNICDQLLLKIKKNPYSASNGTLLFIMFYLNEKKQSKLSPTKIQEVLTDVLGYYDEIPINPNIGYLLEARQGKYPSHWKVKEWVDFIDKNIFEFSITPDYETIDLLQIN